MDIKITPVSFSAKLCKPQTIQRNLIPLLEYKGVILELTPSEKKMIKSLEKRRNDLIAELLNLTQIKSGNRNQAKKDLYDRSVKSLEIRINDLDDLIRVIKSDRFNTQKEKLLL